MFCRIIATWIKQQIGIIRTMDSQEQKLRFYITSPHSCNYLDSRDATSLFADPLFPKNQSLYTALVANGFRRSGEHLYRPYCSNCSECVPVRIPVNEFKYRRQHKRNLKQNMDLDVRCLPAEFNASHFQLYKKYLSARHPNGGMDNPTEDNYRDFLWASWSDTLLFEFKLDNQILAIAVVDKLKDGYSAVYTFFDPEQEKRALGKFAILYLIQKALEENLTWLYLGYWIASCDKMKYKIEYQPIECFIDDEWKKISTISRNDFAVSQN